ncbi:DUF6074 family protein [Rhizobium tumorigenes]|uniref:DUF6074 family protein n=1 Tax=Rhizobium tumorigenes TaxID=2041385 RepID=UPI00241DB82E|nr:DUF6074 family protein [Rhizobium tumorigenes]WFS04783.1 DUF6074 family protein [Rhizobium tumorigenes]
MASKLSELLSVVGDGNIVVFPVASRAGDIERCARELDDKHGTDAVDYWKTECRRLAAQLTAVGLSEDDVRRQVMLFQDEVQAELVRRHQDRQQDEALAEKQG